MLVGGCATVSHQENSEIPLEDMAVIVDTYWGSLRYSKAGIFGVDGEDLNFIERVNVPPGVHSVSIYCAHGYGLGSQFNATTRTVSFTAEPGHKYQVKCSKEDGAWVEDTATNKKVSGNNQINTGLIYANMSNKDKQWRINKEISTYCPNADSGNADAQKHIGDLLYGDNSGLRKDAVRAYVWYRLAAQNGNHVAAEEADKLTDDLTPDQLIEAKRQLDNWVPGQCKQDIHNALPE